MICYIRWRIFIITYDHKKLLFIHIYFAEIERKMRMLTICLLVFCIMAVSSKLWTFDYAKQKVGLYMN